MSCPNMIMPTRENLKIGNSFANNASILELYRLKLFPAAGTQGNRASGRFSRVSDASLGCAADACLSVQCSATSGQKELQVSGSCKQAPRVFLETRN